MRSSKVKKFIAILLLVGQLATWPFLAAAQVGLTTVPVFDSNNGSSPGGIAGIAANAATQAALQGELASFQICLTAAKAFDAADSAKTLSFSGLSLISGGVDMVAQYDAEIASYDNFIACAEAERTAVNLILTPTSFTANVKQQILSQINSAEATYTTKLHNAQARQANATQGFWKTLVFNLLIKVSKSVIDTLVNKLVQNYKINNIKQYVNSVATLMYDNQYIRDNFPDAQSQLMARAVLENPLFRSQIQPAVFVAADNALGFNPGSLSPNDPNFYLKMASVGSGNANPYYQQSVLVSGVDQSHANALATAQTQIAQSSGYKAPVNCAGSLAQQQSIDAQNVAAQQQLANRQSLLYSLQSGGGSASDIAKAQADYNTALAKWNALPYTVTGSSSVASIGANGGNTTEGTMAIVMCEAINSPAALVNQGIDAAMKQAGVPLAQYNNNNLPAFMNIITDVASQIADSLVLGGTAGAKGAALINENKTVSAIAVAGSQAAYSNTLANLANNVNFSTPQPDPQSNVANAYTLQWSVITPSSLNNPSYVTISGDGISATKGTDPKTGKSIPNSLPLSGSYDVITTVGGTYTLTVYDVNGNALTTATQTITVPTPTLSPAGSSLSYNNAGAEVAGAFAEKSLLPLRGEQATLNIRGPQQ